MLNTAVRTITLQSISTADWVHHSSSTIS